jgi:hypothetical protein
MTAAYERNVPRRVLAVVLILFGCLLLALGGVGLWLKYEQSHKQQPPQTTLERERLLPPGPRLQATPRADGQRHWQAMEQRLTEFAWVDRAHGIARIPLKEAQALLLQRGWPEAAP